MSARRRRQSGGVMMHRAGALLLLLLVAGFSTGGWMAWKRVRVWAMDSPLFRTVHWSASGIERADRSRVAEMLDAQLGQSLFRLPVDSLQLELERDPWILEARLIEDWPDALDVVIVEKQGLVRIASGQHEQVLCMDASLLPACIQDRDLPMVHVPETMNELERQTLCAEMRWMRSHHVELFERCERLRWDKTRSLKFEGLDCQVLLHSRNWEHSLSLLEVAARKCEQEWRVWRELDLTFTNQLIWRKSRV